MFQDLSSLAWGFHPFWDKKCSSHYLLLNQFKMTKMKHTWFPVTLSFVLTHSSDRLTVWRVHKHKTQSYRESCVFHFSNFELYFALHLHVLSTFQQHLLQFPTIKLFNHNCKSGWCLLESSYQCPQYYYFHLLFRCCPCLQESVTRKRSIRSHCQGFNKW